MGIGIGIGIRIGTVFSFVRVCPREKGQAFQGRQVYHNEEDQQHHAHPAQHGAWANACVS
jgi:hypothetical protein